MTTGGWRERFLSDDGVVLQAPAAAVDLAAAETALDATLPEALRELYLVTDGVFDGPGQWFVVWPLSDVVERNRADWSSSVQGTARVDLVGFGDDGAGAPFCVPRAGGSGVFVWSAIDAAATRLADTVEEFYARWQASSLPPY
ncbi:SMI1/KNR4 family protein [Amycolatopsis sp. NPDC023774]|uniref:SMI1/KNR4 family protein n=1 Tax=Amycolatopsis sp. NPDC023774 TaxID=3155015 RepID=UPI0033DB8D6D